MLLLMLLPFGRPKFRLISFGTNTHVSFDDLLSASPTFPKPRRRLLNTVSTLHCARVVRFSFSGRLRLSLCNGCCIGVLVRSALPWSLGAVVSAAWVAHLYGQPSRLVRDHRLSQLLAVLRRARRGVLLCIVVLCVVPHAHVAPPSALPSCLRRETMGLFKVLAKAFGWSKKECNIIVVGLDNSGKSTLLKHLQPKKVRCCRGGLPAQCRG